MPAQHDSRIALSDSLRVTCDKPKPTHSQAPNPLADAIVAELHAGALPGRIANGKLPIEDMPDPFV